jgi:hypothetical protein
LQEGSVACAKVAVGDNPPTEDSQDAGARLGWTSPRTRLRCAVWIGVAKSAEQAAVPRRGAGGVRQPAISRVGLEACGRAHDGARELQSPVTTQAAQHVKALSGQARRGRAQSAPASASDLIDASGPAAAPKRCQQPRPPAKCFEEGLTSGRRPGIDQANVWLIAERSSVCVIHKCRCGFNHNAPADRGIAVCPLTVS